MPQDRRAALHERTEGRRFSGFEIPQVEPKRVRAAAEHADRQQAAVLRETPASPRVWQAGLRASTAPNLLRDRQFRFVLQRRKAQLAARQHRDSCRRAAVFPSSLDALVGLFHLAGVDPASCCRDSRSTRVNRRRRTPLPVLAGPIRTPCPRGRPGARTRPLFRVMSPAIERRIERRLTSIVRIALGEQDRNQVLRSGEIEDRVHRDSRDRSSPRRVTFRSRYS